MVDNIIVKEWISKADEDFEFAFANPKEGKTFFAQICFHFQQASEKYLKAYIIGYELEFRKIHDLPVLSVLLKICSSKDPSLDQLREDFEYLAPFYVHTRYPVHWPANFSFQETQKALQSASRIRTILKEKLQNLL
jgi:HEPN domain-containing protein